MKLAGPSRVAAGKGGRLGVQCCYGFGGQWFSFNIRSILNLDRKGNARYHLGFPSGMRCLSRKSHHATSGSRPRCVGDGVLQSVLLTSGGTSLDLPLHVDEIEKMKQFLRDVVGIFQEKEVSSELSGTKKCETAELHVESTQGFDLDFFCNPNAYASVFDASMLVTCTCSKGPRLTLEIKLEHYQNALLAAMQSYQ